MFYSQDILQRNGGKFGKIWLAATHMSKLTRRDVAAIDVERCCDDILTYVELRMPPSYQGGRRPRFSLYLSSLLMSGVVRVHHKQAQYLFADASTTLIRVMSMPMISSNIDLVDLPRPEQVTNPDTYNEPLPLDMDLDSQFQIEAFMNDDSGMKDMDQFWGLNGSSPLTENEESTAPKPKRRKKQQEEVPEPTISMDQITLQDAPSLLMDTPLSPIQVPKELDLPMLDGREMELLMSHVEEPPLQVQDLLPTSTPFQTDTDASTRQRFRTETTTIDSPSITTQRMDAERTPDRVPPMVIPEDRAVPPSPGVTQITSPLPKRQMPGKSLELELTPMTPSPVRRQRKRQLAFADAETQIPKSRMRANLTTGGDTTTPFVLTDFKAMGAVDLLGVPGDKVLRKKPWLPMWERNARFRRNIPESDLAEAISPVQEVAPELTAPEQTLLEELPPPEFPRLPTLDTSTLPVESPFLIPPTSEIRSERRTSTLEQSIEEMRKITSMSESLQGPVAPELSSLEVQRDASGLSLNEELRHAAISLDESLLLDESRQSKKDRSVRKRRTRSSTGDESQAPPPPSSSSSSHYTSHTSAAHTLYDVVEEPRFEAPFTPVPYIDEYDVTTEDFLKKVQDDIEDQPDGSTTFRKICPPQLVDRKTAVSQFTAMLRLCADGRQIIAEQNECFGDIYIRLAQ